MSVIFKLYILSRKEKEDQKGSKGKENNNCQEYGDGMMRLWIGFWISFVQLNPPYVHYCPSHITLFGELWGHKGTQNFGVVSTSRETVPMKHGKTWLVLALGFWWPIINWKCTLFLLFWKSINHQVVSTYTTLSYFF